MKLRFDDANAGQWRNGAHERGLPRRRTLLLVKRRNRFWRTHERQLARAPLSPRPLGHSQRSHSSARPAKAADFTGKAGTNQPPDHPLSVAMKDLWDNVRKETNGRVDVTVFPNNPARRRHRDAAAAALGRAAGDDPRRRILEAVVPVGAIQSVGFAFPDSAAAFRASTASWARTCAARSPRRGCNTFDKIWENGMREITTSTKPVRNAVDIAGMKIRTPNSRMALDLFKALGASPTPINFSELYTALQTRVVDGQENPLANIEFARFFEVQKYLSMSSHMWGGYWLLAENEWWSKIPADAQAIITRNASTITDRQRRDIMKLNDSLVGKLQSQGMTVNTLGAADRAGMKAKLSDYYKRWKAEFGDTPGDCSKATPGNSPSRRLYSEMSDASCGARRRRRSTSARNVSPTFARSCGRSSRPRARRA